MHHARPFRAARCASLAIAPETVRYFAVWSYTQNAPSNELSASDLGARTLGYWELRLDDTGLLERASYHGSNGSVWLSVRLVADGGHVYADVYNAEDQFVVRKSTQLRDMRPR